MTIQIINNENGTLIQGDAEILKRLPESFDVATVDLTGVRVDAHNLAIAAEYGSYKSVDHVKFYAALKQAFIEQQALDKAYFEPEVIEEEGEETEEA